MLKFTKNQADLLGLFFTNPERQFYIQELGRTLAKRPGSFQRTLYSLEKQGILLSEYKANARFFMVNKNHALYQELKSIVFKTVGVAGSIEGILRKAGRVRFAFIFGSYAKGRENYLSDVDVFIVGSPDEDLLIREFDRLEVALKREINFKLHSESDFGERIDTRDPFLLNLQREKKLWLVGNENEYRGFLKERSRKKGKPRLPAN
jgi:predicted nucleotidyltransferase